MRITPSRPSHLWFWLFPSETLHRFASLALKSRIDAHLRAFPGKTLHRFASLGLKSRIDARLRAFPGKTLHRFPSSPPQIKNHCRTEAVSGQKPAVIPKFTPSNQESLHAGGRFRAKTCSDSQVHPLKSRITARWRPFPGKNLQ